ncbi:hypothetical protein Lepto7375DRAFT_1005 [Leptolyngbya sp. PCC 7375]|nr:hypothetical protein Lepto7375DRAFT_1005 [Leptolyngbya sp. PCC 7375]
MIYRSSINDQENITPLSTTMWRFLSIGILSLVLGMSPYMSKAVLAQNFWVRLAQELFIEAAKESFRNHGRNELPVQQSAPFDDVIATHIAGKRVDFSNADDGRHFTGTVTSSWVQRNNNTSRSGAAGSISWEDGVVSSILFLENQRVRIWSGDTEYGGQWIANEGILYVKTDVGSLYRFY